MSDMTPEAARDLRKPFPPESVGKLPKGGTMLDYVGHAAVTDRLLTVDPHWSWEPFAVTPEGLPALDRAGNLWIRLTVCGVTRIGVGDGKNAKEIVGDALRNAAMRFGVALDLWAKENLVEFAQAAQAHQAPPAPRTVREITPTKELAGDQQGPLLLNTTSKLAKAMYASLGNEFGTDRDRTLAFVSEVVGREITSTKELTEDEARRVLDHLPAAATS